MASMDHWRRKPRENAGPFDAGPMQGKASLKTLEEEIERQTKALHSHFQRDLDLLHEQVHNEVYSALSQELVSVAQNLTSIRMEAHNSMEELRNSGGALEQNLDVLTSVLERMREELNLVKKEVKVDLKQLRDRDLPKLHEGVQTSLAQAKASMQEEMSSIREEAYSAQASLISEQKTEPVPDDFITRFAELEAKLPQVELDFKEAMSSEAAERATRAGELAMAVELSRAEARQSAEQLEASIRAIATEAEQRNKQVEETVQLQTAEKFRETKTIFADIEKRLDENIGAAIVAESNAKANEAASQVADQCKTLEDRVGTLVREVELQFDDARKDIRQLNDACREGLGFAHNCWTRTVEWMASVDLDELHRTGRFDLESPEFMAAGLRGLQLCLRLAAVEKPGGKARWTCGAFLRGSVGQVSFRLHAAGKGQSFAGDFANAPEWGSQRIVTLESVGAAVPVRLEILDVQAEVPAQIGAPAELISTFQMTDAARVAAREADKVRSSMVKRIEWRIVHISERIAAARAAVAAGQAEQQALEPLLSPTFSAGGLEGLQLQLYPLGYLRSDDVMPSSRYEEKCGFFLVCPRGVYIKCRAFVGDQVKIFEYQYSEREPYGRPNFCRLLDKAGSDDCVVCGIEILDVRQELTTQVKGGPGGSIVDQMKVTLAPSLGSMEVMRELRDAAGDRDRSMRNVGRRQPAAGAYPSSSHAAADLAPLGPSMVLSNAKSLPALLPDGVTSKAAAQEEALLRHRLLGGHLGTAHARSGNGSWPPSPGGGSPAKQKTRLPKI